MSIMMVSISSCFFARCVTSGMYMYSIRVRALARPRRHPPRSSRREGLRRGSFRVCKMASVFGVYARSYSFCAGFVVSVCLKVSSVSGVSGY